MNIELGKLVAFPHHYVVNFDDYFDGRNQGRRLILDSNGSEVWVLADAVDDATLVSFDPVAHSSVLTNAQLQGISNSVAKRYFAHFQKARTWIGVIVVGAGGFFAARECWELFRKIDSCLPNQIVGPNLPGVDVFHSFQCKISNPISLTVGNSISLKIHNDCHVGVLLDFLKSYDGGLVAVVNGPQGAAKLGFVDQGQGHYVTNLQVYRS